MLVSLSCPCSAVLLPYGWTILLCDFFSFLCTLEIEQRSIGPPQYCFEIYPSDYPPLALVFFQLQVLCGIKYMHALNIIHRDLKVRIFPYFVLSRSTQKARL